MQRKVEIMDDVAIKRGLARITHEIIEQNQGVDNICLLGIKRRGIPLAKMLADNIKKFEGVDVPVGYIDITQHRDDLTAADKAGAETDYYFPCSINDMRVILVDDVLFTGRTARAAIEAVFEHGRPKTLQFAVLVDRGHREVPIRADYVVKNIPTSLRENVSVCVEEIDGESAVYITSDDE